MCLDRGSRDHNASLPAVVAAEKLADLEKFEIRDWTTLRHKIKRLTNRSRWCIRLCRASFFERSNEVAISLQAAQNVDMLCVVACRDTARPSACCRSLSLVLPPPSTVERAVCSILWRLCAVR